MPLAAIWMNLEIILLSEISWTEKDKYLICLILKNDTNEFIYKTETDSQSQRMNLWLPRGKGLGRDSQGVWDEMYSLVYLKQITNKDLLCKTGNSAQYSVIT